MKITDEQMAAFLDGDMSAEEFDMMLDALGDNPELQSVLSISDRVDEDLEENTQLYSILPITRMASKSKGHLCDLQCEEWILTRRNIAVDHARLSEQALQNRWLREKGTPLHHMGRLLEENGLDVSRRYDATLDDIKALLEEKADIIVVVDNSILNGREREEDDFHAVTVIFADEASVRIFDPATGKPYENCISSHFVKAWEGSSRYMVIAKMQDSTYQPSPINVEDVSFPDDLVELREAIAENTQEVWASARMAEGWRYGPLRDDKRKEHPDLIPYSRLSEGEKEYNRILADNTIKIVKKFGFDLVKSRDTETYHILIHRLQHSDQEYRCSQCGTVIFKTNKYCSECGRRLEDKDFL